MIDLLCNPPACFELVVRAATELEGSLSVTGAAGRP